MVTKIIVALALLSFARAQTPEGFVPSVSSHLDVLFGTKAVSPPGMSLTKAETAKQPIIGTNETLTGTYLFMMIDLDVPASFTNPSSGPRRTNLHAMIQDFKPDGQTSAAGVQTLASSAKTPVAYIGPAPPAETPPHPHRYVTLLFEQPEGFTVPESQKLQIRQKIGFNVTTFIEAAALKAPVAGNYFTVSG